MHPNGEQTRSVSGGVRNFSLCVVEAITERCADLGADQISPPMVPVRHRRGRTRLVHLGMLELRAVSRFQVIGLLP